MESHAERKSLRQVVQGIERRQVGAVDALRCLREGKLVALFDAESPLRESGRVPVAYWQNIDSKQFWAWVDHEQPLAITEDLIIEGAYLALKEMHATWGTPRARAISSHLVAQIPEEFLSKDNKQMLLDYQLAQIHAQTLRLGSDEKNLMMSVKLHKVIRLALTHWQDSVRAVPRSLDPYVSMQEIKAFDQHLGSTLKIYPRALPRR